MCEIVLKSGVREWAMTNRRTYGYSLESASVYLALGDVMCRDHTHSFNELMYIAAPCMVIKKSFDADEPGFSSMPKRRMRAWSVGVAVSADPPADSGGTGFGRKGTRDSSVGAGDHIIHLAAFSIRTVST